MISLSTTQILNLLIQYKYILLFPIAVIEGPIITMIGGFLVSLGYLNFFVAYAVLVVGDVTGDVVYYMFGRWGRKSFISKWGKYFGFNPERIDQVEKHFKENGEKTLFLGKITHAAGTVFLITAGLVKMPLWKFIRINFLGTMIKSMVLMLIGYYFGEAIGKVNSFLEFITYLFAAVLIATAMSVFIYYRQKEVD